MNDDEDAMESTDGALSVGHNIGDNLATRAILAALIGRIAAERDDGAALITNIYKDATAYLLQAIDGNAVLEARSFELLENFMNRVEVTYETLTGLPAGGIHDLATSSEEED